MKRLTDFARILAIGTLLCVGGCDTGPKSAEGFRLPDGNAEVGLQNFVELGCNDCHKIKGFSVAAPAIPEEAMVELGGTVSRVKTYGELVSSVINPSHRISGRHSEQQVSLEGESLMRLYNETMTVQQLIDLVAFLQSKYEVVLPEYKFPHSS